MKHGLINGEVRVRFVLATGNCQVTVGVQFRLKQLSVALVV